MTAKTTGETARIYQFPSTRVSTLKARREASEAAGVASMPGAVGSGWYHEAAIAEEEVEQGLQQIKPTDRH